MSAPLPVSLCMITRDEARNLPMSLGAAKGQVDEIVVLDSGSKDATLEVARRYADRVEVRPFTDFADQKNAAVALARHDWVLVLDADEVLEPGAWAFIARLAHEGFRGCAAFAFPRKTRSVDGAFHRWVNYYPNFQDRLFDRRRCRHVRPIHERLEIGGRRGCVPFHIVHEHVYERERFHARSTQFKGMFRAASPEVFPPGERLRRSLSRLAFELKALYVDMALPLDPGSWGFLARWTVLRFCPPLRRLGDRTAWTEKQNRLRGLTD